MRPSKILKVSGVCRARDDNTGAKIEAKFALASFEERSWSSKRYWCTFNFPRNRNIIQLLSCTRNNRDGGKKECRVRCVENLSFLSSAAWCHNSARGAIFLNYTLLSTLIQTECITRSVMNRASSSLRVHVYVCVRTCCVCAAHVCTASLQAQ